MKGFRQRFKQKIVLEYLKTFNFDIVFLQETHVTNMREANIIVILSYGPAVRFGLLEVTVLVV